LSQRCAERPWKIPCINANFYLLDEAP